MMVGAITVKADSPESKVALESLASGWNKIEGTYAEHGSDKQIRHV